MPGRTVAQMETALDQLISIVISQEGETIEGVTFESAVADGDIVYLDDSVNIWKQSLAQNVDKGTFYGVAIIDTTDKVQVAGRITNDDFRIWDEVNSVWVNAFTSGKPLYASKTKAGKMTHDDTGLLCGVATGSYTFVMNLAFQTVNAIHELQMAVDALETEVAKKTNLEFRTVTDNVLILTTDELIYVDATAGLVTLTSLTAAEMIVDGATRYITVKRINLTGGAVRINGVTGVPGGYIDLTGPLDYVTLASDGTSVHYIGG